jgi:hypothetical protein
MSLGFWYWGLAVCVLHVNPEQINKFISAGYCSSRPTDALTNGVRQETVLPEQQAEFPSEVELLA